METEQTDVVVIGLGVGGEDAAGKLAEAGLHVTGVEARLVGGECPYWACVPSKMMIRAANLLTEARRIAGMASTSTGPGRSGGDHRIAVAGGHRAPHRAEGAGCRRGQPGRGRAHDRRR